MVLALLIISIQNIAIKWISGEYSVLQIVVIRSLVSLPITLAFYLIEGGRGLPSTKLPFLEIIRGLFLFLSYTSAMMGLATLQLGDFEAIRFSAPLMISGLSVLVLGEKIRIGRWLALAGGFIGVILIVQPGTSSFDLGAVFALISVLFYALTVILTRKLQDSDSSATMAYFSSFVYLAAALLFTPLPYLITGSPNTHPGFAFLLREWGMPSFVDLLIMSGLALVWAGWMFFMAKAYSEAQASLIAPFEYLSLPINILWGLLIWGDLPTLQTLAGALLAMASGWFVIFHEKKA